MQTTVGRHIDPRQVRAALTAVAEEGRRTVLANHTRAAVARYILDELATSANARMSLVGCDKKPTNSVHI